MAVAAVAQNAEHGHWGDRLNDNNAVQNQVPEGKRAPKARSGGDGRGTFH